MSTGTTTGQGHRVDWMRAHYDEIMELFDRFEPREEFRRCELPVFLRHAFDGFKSNNIIHQVRRESDRTENQWRWVWTIDERAYDWVTNYEPISYKMPCGHHGIVNLGDGEFQCCCSWCDETHKREKLEA